MGEWALSVRLGPDTLKEQAASIAVAEAPPRGIAQRPCAPQHSDIQLKI